MLIPAQKVMKIWKTSFKKKINTFFKNFGNLHEMQIFF